MKSAEQIKARSNACRIRHHSHHEHPLLHLAAHRPPHTDSARLEHPDFFHRPHRTRRPGRLGGRSPSDRRNQGSLAARIGLGPALAHPIHQLHDRALPRRLGRIALHPPLCHRRPAYLLARHARVDHRRCHHRYGLGRPGRRHLGYVSQPPARPRRPRSVALLRQLSLILAGDDLSDLVRARFGLVPDQQAIACAGRAATRHHRFVLGRQPHPT